MQKLLTYILLICSFNLIAQDRKIDVNLLSDYFKITDDSQTDYPIKDIMQGCPKVDCIPSIDAPKFISATKVDFLKDHDLILAITIAGQTRVYPAVILQQHEIVNDQISGIPFAITYCPLCGTGVAFSRKIKGSVVKFGVSGILHGSDLVMYDRKNKNLWQQLTGVSFAGPDRGYQLKSLPLTMTDWKTWRHEHPDSMVLSNSKDKLMDNYAKYRSSDRVMFGGVTDARLNPKRVVYGLTVNNQAIAIDFEMIKIKKNFEIKSDNIHLEIQYKKDGTVIVKNNNKVYQIHRSYWFAWYTFNPNTLLFK